MIEWAKWAGTRIRSATLSIDLTNISDGLEAVEKVSKPQIRDSELQNLTTFLFSNIRHSKCTTHKHNVLFTGLRT